MVKYKENDFRHNDVLYLPVKFRHNDVLCLVGRSSGREVDAVRGVSFLRQRQQVAVGDGRLACPGWTNHHQGNFMSQVQI